MTHLTMPRWHATYELRAIDEQEASLLANGIAVEQTIEYPYELVRDTWFATEMCGQVESLEPLPNGCWKTRISYPSEAIQGDLLELINMLYGNSSLQFGVRLLDFDLPSEIVREYPGARYGISGLRRRWQVPQGPLLMAVLKPIGHTSKAFADMAYAFAAGGFHTIKDDHSLHDQSWSPFRERVLYCVDAVARANDQHGRQASYLTNITSPGTTLLKRAYFAQEAGADGVMISPSLTGWGMILELSKAADFHLPIILHPSYSGPFIRSKETGMEPAVYNAYLPRLTGADGVIFTGTGGRFSFPIEDCLKTQQYCLSQWHHLAPILPALGGGVHIGALPQIHSYYGSDIMLLVGGDLFRPGPDLRANAQHFREEVYRVFQC